MKVAQTKAELLGYLHSTRDEWESLLAQVGNARLEVSGVEADWMVKDIVAHLRYWEQTVVDYMQGLERGEDHGLPHDTLADIDRRNGENYAANHARPVADVLADSRRTFEQLVALTEQCSETDLFTPGRYAWSPDLPLKRLISGESYGHYDDHLPKVRAWLERQA